MKKQALTLALAMAALCANAETKPLTVIFNDKTYVTFSLADTPDVTFADDKMTVTTSSTTASYELWKVDSFTYDRTATGINSVNETAENDIAMEGNNIIVGTENCKVNVYSLNGTAASVATTTAGGKTIVDLDSLRRGTYIIKINDKAIKITRQ